MRVRRGAVSTENQKWESLENERAGFYCIQTADPVWACMAYVYIYMIVLVDPCENEWDLATVNMFLSRKECLQFLECQVPSTVRFALSMS